MRVFQFVTLFLALTVVCGCSHRRAQRNPYPVTASFCDCSTCRHDQERLVREGAIPAEHFQAYEGSGTAVPFEATAPLATAPLATAPLATAPLATAPLAAPPAVNDFSPEYSNAISESSSQSTSQGSTTKSRYSSGNPIEMGDEAPQAFGAPVVDEIKSDIFQVPPSNTTNDLQLNLLDSGDIPPIDQVPTETLPDGAFKPFNREVFKVKSEIENTMPLNEQPSILIDKVSESFQPDLGSFTPPTEQPIQLPQLDEPESNDFQLPSSSAPNHLTLEQEQPEKVETVESNTEPAQPYLTLSEPEIVSPAPQEAAPLAQTFAPVPRPIRQTETVVEGELYEDPVVLYARQRRDMLTTSAVQAPGTVKPTSMQKPVEHQSIVQNSEFDPVYGLPLNNDVQFDSLPAIQQPPVAPSNQPQHLHVHIHHDYNQAAAGQVRHSDQAGPQARNVQVVYRDDEGRVIMAPPTPTGSIHSAEPTGDQRTYYVPPEQILRLKATSPINRPRANPSVATIQMRDTIIHGGTHLLATPDYKAKPVLREHGLPGIDYKQIQEAFNSSATDNPLR